MSYILVYLISFIGTKFSSLDGTILFFKKIGLCFGRMLSFTQDVDTIEKRLAKAMHKVPFAIKCLDQAVAAWFWLNLNGHPATLRIGVSITPLESHAWVILGDRILVNIPSIPDLHVVAEYGSWNARDVFHA